MRYVLMAFFIFCGVQLMAQDNSNLEGRWDLTIAESNKTVPSWIEIILSGHRTMVGSFVASTGSTRPISKIFTEGNKFSFSIPPQWETTPGDIVIKGEVHENSMHGTITESDGTVKDWIGVRAPELKRSGPIAWGKPIPLIGKTGLANWEAIGGSSEWSVFNGVLSNKKMGANLKTKQRFSDFKLHVEFKYPSGSNSGIYLRGRHELQIADSKGPINPKIMIGSIYGFLAPVEHAGKEPDVWQTYDITLIGRQVTVVLNGKTVICNGEIPGITGGALDSREGEPGPIYLQGDHGPVKFRNIIITPAK